MTEAEILAEWEARFGTLSTEQRVRFLEKGGHVKRLVSLPDDAVREAIFDRRRLDEIETLASGKQRQRRSQSLDLGADDRHPSEYGSMTIRRPGQPEHVVDLGLWIHVVFDSPRTGDVPVHTEVRAISIPSQGASG